MDAAGRALEVFALFLIRQLFLVVAKAGQLVVEFLGQLVKGPVLRGAFRAELLQRHPLRLGLGVLAVIGLASRAAL